MQLVLRSRDGDHDVDVDVRNPGATVGDLLSAVLGAHAPGIVYLDDRRISAACPVGEAGLYDGGMLRHQPGGNGAGAARGGD
ncbi:MAG TPA: hypothetical protein VF587_03825, partial [Solirubrobacteraceae bacterium]